MCIAKSERARGRRCLSKPLGRIVARIQGHPRTASLLVLAVPFFATLMVTVALGQKIPPVQPVRPGWKLVFQDEFEGASIDTTKWNVRDPWGKERNQELQAYVTDAFEMKNGTLRIRAERRRAFYDGKEREFTAGMMTTYGKFSQQYGRFEIRCRVPKGKGLWPACWLLPEPLGWPPEIDILEVLGHDTKTIYFTHHWEEGSGKYKSDGGKWQGPEDFGSEFHVIAAEWTPSDIRWEVDGQQRFRSTRSIPRKPMYLLLNLAVGGQWPGSPDEKTVFPAHFEVDYVRVYNKE
jgi:beta-glucanase (GH16 family)